MRKTDLIYKKINLLVFNFIIFLKHKKIIKNHLALIIKESSAIKITTCIKNLKSL